MFRRGKSLRIDMRLPTSLDSVRTLQTTLQTKAKNEPAARFYSLWDKVTRWDVLAEAYRRCRSNRGAPGVDGESFAAIDAAGRDQWLERLQQELQAKTYQPQPLLRVWIPKANGGERPLAVPCIRDRVAQMAVLLVIGPIFEPDLSRQQYAFRAGVDAKMALRRIHFAITRRGKREVVDADLADYFTSIPHADLMRCAARRIADGTLLSVMRTWLTVPVRERSPQGERQTTQAKDAHRGVPQGSVISPLLSNLYFRRFMLAWYGNGYAERHQAEVVNYADDFVLLCRPGHGEAAMADMRKLMSRLGLTVNEEKTRLVNLPDEQFDFLGYTIGRFYGKGGRPFWGTRPSKKAVKRLMREVHDATTSRWNALDVDSRVQQLNPLLRGWAGYFNQGPVAKVYRHIDNYVARRLRIWLMRKRGKRGTGYRQYPDQYLYEELGLMRLVPLLADRSNAKV